MELKDLPPLEVGKKYRIKIYDEQPFPDLLPHQQIREKSLGQSHEGEFLGAGKCERTSVEMLDFQLDEYREFAGEPRRVLGCFHLWLIESIEEVQGDG